MRLTCPCGLHGSIELFTGDEHARRFAAIVAKLPAGLGTVAVSYIGLFRPGKRALAWDRACKLLEEMRQMVDSGAVERRGRRYPATPTLFASAMQQMLDGRERLELPLTSHGYLISIVAGDSPREAARQEEAQEQQKREASQRRSGERMLAFADLAGEVAARKRLQQPEMTAEERRAFLSKYGVEE